MPAPDARRPAPAAADALRLVALTRTFTAKGAPDRVALDAVDLALPVGGVHGLLGPNGAGKTTLCRIAATVLLPSSGRAEVLGHDVVTEAATVRRLIGIVFGGERGLYGRLSATENLRFWCAMHGLSRREARVRSDALLERLGLAARASEKVETFSRGMKQRLHLARGLVSDPRVLILDEPTVGMDPVSAHDFRDLIGELRTEGRTIVLTTHDMAEAEAVCDSVTFIDRGTVVGAGTPATVRRMLARGRRVQVHDVDAEQARLLGLRVSGLGDVRIEHHPRDARAEIVLTGEDPHHDPAGLVGEILTAVMAAGHTSVTAAPPSLEDVYLELLGNDPDAPGSTGRGMAV